MRFGDWEFQTNRFRRFAVLLVILAGVGCFASWTEDNYDYWRSNEMSVIRMATHGTRAHAIGASSASMGDLTADLATAQTSKTMNRLGVPEPLLSSHTGYESLLDDDSLDETSDTMESLGIGVRTDLDTGEMITRPGNDTNTGFGSLNGTSGLGTGLSGSTTSPR